MRMRFLVAGMLAGGIILSVLGWLTAAILPPRYKQFRDPRAVVETIRANVSVQRRLYGPSGIVRLGLVGARSLEPVKNVGPHLAGQFITEFAVAFGLSLLLMATRIRSPFGAAAFLGLLGMVAGTEVHFPEWNWSGFPISHLAAGIGYLGANWFITGVVLGTLRRRLDS